MRASFRERPPWLARVGEVGAGVLIAPDLVLTCDHVVPTDTVHVSLVHHGWSGAATVVFRAPVAEDQSGDVAVLRLSSPVPDAVVAPLRAPAALADHPYVVQGFAGGRHAEARGRLGGRITAGWVQMNGDAGHVVDRGFSGAPVWDEVAEAVVGIVVMAQKSVRGGGLIPIEEVVRLWPEAAAHVGWRVDPDDTHWLPRARGVEPHDPTDEWHFVGRHRALHDLATYLAGPGDGRVRAVIGSPGSGKSAVVARTVVLADRLVRPRVPPDSLSPDVALPPLGSVTVAVHARGKTLSQVVQAIADGAEVEAADPVELVQRCGPISVVVDALDEATGDAPIAIATMLHRLATNPTRHVVVGTRVGARNSPSNLLLTRLGNAVVLDLDSPTYLDPADLLHYAQRRVGVGPLADQIAHQSNGNFLIAQLTALTAMSGGTSLATTVGAAVDDYLSIRFDNPTKIRELLLPLAFAEGSGLPEGDLWLSLANALSATTYTARDLREALTSAASYLVEQSGRHYRLFHQALDDTFRTEYQGPAPDQVVYETLRTTVTTWPTADHYTRTNLPAHAATAGRLDELVEDLDFMLAVSPECIVHHLPNVTTDRARTIRHVYRRTVHRFDADPGRRVANFALVARQSGFDTLADEVAASVPWRVEVLAWNPDDEQQIVLDPPPMAGVGLWFDPEGSPSALVATSGRMALYRFEDYRLTLAESQETRRLVSTRAIFHEATPDGREFALTANEDGTVHRWSLTHGLAETGADRVVGPWDLPIRSGDSTCAADGRLLAVLVCGSVLHLLDWTDDTPEVVCRSEDVPGRQAAAITVLGGEVLIAHARGEEVVLLALRDGHLVQVGTPLPGFAGALRFTTLADGTCLLLVGGEDGLRRAEVTAHGLATTDVLDRPPGRSITTATLPSGRTVVAVSSLHDDIVVLDATEGLVPLGAPRRGPRVWELAVGLGPWGTPLVLTFDFSRVRLWELDHVSAAVREPWPADRRPVDVVAVEGSGVLAVTTGRGVCRVWSVFDRVAELGSHRNGGSRVEAAFDPDGSLVASVDENGGLDVCEVSPHGLAPRWRTTVPDLDFPVQTLAVNRDGTDIVVVVHDDAGTGHWLRHDGTAWRDETVGDLPWEVSPLPYRLGGEARFLVEAVGSVIGRPGRPPVELGLDFTAHVAVARHGGGVPVVVFSEVYSFRLASLADDTARRWGTPVPHDGWTRVALGLPRPDLALVAYATGRGTLHVWACPESGAARRLASIELESLVDRMAWTDDRRLVVFCEAGVLRFSGF
ncbi:MULTISPECIES: trypsin-like peptidase domain-containing protein [unclassified Saccharothrix]|uniref:trypsin-like peptidase domain-containing protein n=1 Tax=unclassified Saccharothrix TaxID=2593673 RepID=UPI00307E93D2